MAEDKKLNADEVLVLKWRGFTTNQILNINVGTFDVLYADNVDEYERLINKANGILDRQDAMNIRAISCHDTDYPASLKAIGNDAPALIYCVGNTGLLERSKAVAIIGARAADREGLDASFRLGQSYAEQGYVVVSGLALGCDKAAHEGCLKAGGETIAIVGSGLDIIHPRENTYLQRQILEAGGLILSEQLIGVKANPTTLVARNRLQAALSEAVILGQCPVQSGSMHTMRFARQYHKKCYAVEFPKATEANGGNRFLISSNQAKPIKA